MSWHGIGLISGGSWPINLLGAYRTPPPQLQPGAVWDGTAASGYSETPVDPVRTTAKPAVRLLVPPYQWFTDTLDVGVIAAANDSGSLANTLGIESIRFFYEGSEVVVTEPRWHSIHTLAGVRTYFGWWVRLAKPVDRAGIGHLYVEATARDITMQKRVIGPYVFCPQDTRYDLRLEIAPSQAEIIGERYQSIPAAATYVKQQNKVNALLTITEAGLYTELGPNDAPTRFTDPGYLNITASVTGVIFGKTGFVDDVSARFTVPRMKIHFMGPNLAFDWRYVTVISEGVTDVADHWLDGVTIYSSSPNGRFELWRGGMKPNASGSLIGGRPWFTEVTFRDVDTPANGASLVRGCDIKDVGNDIVKGSRCCVFNVVRDHHSLFWGNEVPAISLHYTGAEPTATLARSGGNIGHNGGVYTLTIGAATHTFDVGTGSSQHWEGALGDGYWLSDLADWLNSFDDVTATLSPEVVADDRVAASGSLTGLKGQGFPATDIKTHPLEVISYFDVHGDFYQQGSGDLENCIIAFNRGWNIRAQLVILSGINNATTKDVIFFANALSTPTGSHISQIGRPGHTMSHLVFAHMTLANQRFTIRSANEGFTMDEYCLFKNNSFQGLGFSGSVFEQVTVDGLHIHGSSLPPPLATRVASGGDETTLYVDALNGDYTPTGALLSSGVPAGVPFDLERTAFPAITAPGAIAAPATELVPPPPSEDPEGDLIALVGGTGGVSSVHHYEEAQVTNGVWISLDQSSNGNDHRQATASRQPVISAAGAEFDGNDRLEQDGDAAGKTITLVMAFTKTDASMAGNFMSTLSGYNPVSYNASQDVGHPNTVRVNGLITKRRTETYLALHQTGECVVTIEGLTLDAALIIGRHSGGLAGTVRRVIVLDHDALGENTELAVSLAQQVAAIG